MCGKSYLCTQGGLDGICCISCHRLGACQQPCNTAEILKTMREKKIKPDRCEHMIGGEQEEEEEDQEEKEEE